MRTVCMRLLLPQVPFRLTRMMVKAMEVAGIEGNFRWMCVPAHGASTSICMSCPDEGRPFGAVFA